MLEHDTVALPVYYPRNYIAGWSCRCDLFLACCTAGEIKIGVSTPAQNSGFDSERSIDEVVSRYGVVII